MVTLFPIQRHERLLGELRRCGAVRVRELAGELGVSELTIRRDIAALAARNLLTKVHGGATLPSHVRAAGRPRPAGAGLTIGMVVPSLDFSWPPVVAGARAAAAALGVSVQLRGPGHDPEEDDRQLGALIDSGRLQGLLLAPGPDGGDALTGRLSVPAVLVEHEPRRWSAAPRQLDWVRTDHGLGLKLALHHLHEQGHRRIALLLAEGSPAAAFLLDAWEAARAGLGLRAAPAFVRPVLPGVPADCRAAGITALIAHSDQQAVGVAQACAEEGLRVPEDLAIVAYDDEIAHLAEPALTAVRPPRNHVGRLAVELLVSRLLDGDRRPGQGVLVAPELIVRGSSLYAV